jgi:hypothetical protein
MTHAAAPESSPPTPPGTTERFLISFILDRTGSMSSCMGPTISGFNEFLHQQQTDPNGECFFSLTLFDRPGDGNAIEERFVARPIQEIPDLGTPANPFEPRGNTPLYDAVGQVVRTTEQLAPGYTRVLLVIQTDGEENASRDWTRERIFDLITGKQQEGWAVTFMGADQNAWATSQAMGVPMGNTMSYGSKASQAAFARVSAGASAMRSAASHGQHINNRDYFQTGGEQAAVGIDPAQPGVSSRPVPHPVNRAPRPHQKPGNTHPTAPPSQRTDSRRTK